MGKAKAKRRAEVKLQIPVSEAVSEEIGRLAERFDRTHSWMAMMLLKVCVGDRDRFGQWLANVVLKGLNNVWRSLKGTPLQEGDTVRIYVVLDQELLDEITDISRSLDETPVKTAGRLLTSGVMENEWIIKAVTSEITASVFGRSDESAEKTKRKGKGRAT